MSLSLYSIGHSKARPAQLQGAVKLVTSPLDESCRALWYFMPSPWSDAEPTHLTNVYSLSCTVLGTWPFLSVGERHTHLT